MNRATFGLITVIIIPFIPTEVFAMLVLSRREGERIKLGDSIIITVVGVSGDKVRVGVEAPSNVVVLREELQPYLRDDADGQRRRAA
jgi:carbon storage regulator